MRKAGGSSSIDAYWQMLAYRAAAVPLACSPRRTGWPLGNREGRQPEAQGPEHDRDEVLDPAMQRGCTKCERRQMGRCCVVEDTDQNVDHKDPPNWGGKEPCVCGDSFVCFALGGETPRHLGSPPLQGTGTAACSSCRQGLSHLRATLRSPSSTTQISPGPFRRIANISPCGVLTCRTACH